MEDFRIKGLGLPGLPGGVEGVGDGPEGPSGPSFSHALKESIEKVNQLQQEADQAVQDLAVGNKENLHQTMIAMEKASTSFQLMMQVRNKIVSAYEEMMRMQV